MTCRHALSILDASVDNELSPNEQKELEQHIAQCSKCAEEFNQLRQIRKQLQELKVPDPGPKAWDEQLNLILAKTTGALPQPETKLARIHGVTPAQRRAFVGAVLSFAASLAIFISALVLGTAHQQQMAQGESEPIHFANSFSLLVDNQQEVGSISEAEREQLTRGLVMLSPPGVIGRVEFLPALLAMR